MQQDVVDLMAASTERHFADTVVCRYIRFQLLFEFLLFLFNLGRMSRNQRENGQRLQPELARCCGRKFRI